MPLDSVGQRGGRMVIGQRLSGCSLGEQPGGVAAVPLEQVEVLGEPEGLLVAAPDEGDDFVLPGTDDLAVALVDPGDEVPVVVGRRRVLECRAGQATLVVGDAGG